MERAGLRSRQQQLCSFRPSTGAASSARRQRTRRSCRACTITAASVASDPREKSKGWLTAFDASTGKERWKYASPTPLVAGVTATSGGVLFTGDLNNDFLALDATTGDVLYRFNTGGSIGGGVISYALGGKQYVATTSGTVSAFFGGSGLPAVVDLRRG